MKNRITLLTAGLLLLSACSAFGGDTTITPAGGDTATSPTVGDEAAGTSTTAGASTSDTARSVELGSCSDPSDEFAVFCNAYEIITAHYVDPIDPSDLADGAEQGLSEFLQPGGEVPGTDTTVVCSIPTQDFEGFCGAFGDELDEGIGTPAELVEAAITGMVDIGLPDANSVYLSPEALATFRIDTTGSVEGIGALVRGQDTDDPDGEACQILSETCHMVIVQPLEGSPAEAAGIEAGDFVVAVDGQDIEGWTIDEVVAVVRGPAGTDVRLGIQRGEERFQVVIERAAITVPNVESEVLEAGIGYLRLAMFAGNADEALHVALAELLDAGAQSIIFDVRSNPGGSLQSAVAVASEFLSGGDVVRTTSPLEDTEYPVISGGLATDPEIELMVLVDRGSASASEVVAAVLQERERATIIGERTFGKNTVQQQFNLDNGGAVKVTIARWLTPGGTDFGEGVQPDVLIEFDVGAEEDPWISAALELLGG